MNAQILPFPIPPLRNPNLRDVTHLHDQMGKAIERLIQTQMETYPSTWTDQERREMAMRHLGLDGPEDAA